MQYATYCPEDNKLRLYIGRVPREEYLKLRDEGWKALHKQREAGGGDFVATWTPERRDTAMSYSDDGIIYDEDMGPEERAADRAERFSGYRDKRTDEAVGKADACDLQPTAHGFQSQAKAERAAARHDRMADRACDVWSKAEYWTRRTEGVIRNALYKSSPGVRMGRIKELESLLRKHEKNLEEYRAQYANWKKIAAIEDPAKQTETARNYAGYSHSGWSRFRHPRPENVSDYYKNNDVSLHSLLTHETDPITGAEAVALYFSNHAEPREDNDWSLHYKLRLAYESQMLAAQGGMLEQCEVLVGGKLGNKLILKVNKSPATGRATSVSILGPRVKGYSYRSSNIPGTEWAEHQFDLERMEPEAYTPPTEESLAELAEVKAAIKAAAPKKPECPLINPTDEDAERLQAIWNERAKTRHCEMHMKTYGKDYVAEFQPATVTRILQVTYSANSKGSYAKAETRGLCSLGRLEPRAYYYAYEKQRQDALERGPVLCKIRVGPGGGKQYTPESVVILTDKPQKPLPASVWKTHQQAVVRVKQEEQELVLA